MYNNEQPDYSHQAEAKTAVEDTTPYLDTSSPWWDLE